MGNPKASSVAPAMPLEGESIVDVDLNANELNPREFHFAVTWVTLFARLDPLPSTGPRRRIEVATPTLALVPVVTAPLVPQRAASPNSGRDADRDSAAWEMVVPKMI